MKTAALVHIVTGKNIRMLHDSTREVRSIPLFYLLCPLSHSNSLSLLTSLLSFQNYRLFMPTKTNQEVEPT